MVPLGSQIVQFLVPGGFGEFLEGKGRLKVAYTPSEMPERCQNGDVKGSKMVHFLVPGGSGDRFGGQGGTKMASRGSKEPKRT